MWLIGRLPDSMYGMARALWFCVDWSRIVWHSMRSSPFVLVYQQGRVGSTTVFESLRRIGLKTPIYHVHTLSPSRAQRLIQDNHRQGKRVPRYLIVGRLLGVQLQRHLRNVEQGLPKKPWNVVSVFRDPISILISLHFLHPEASFGSIIENGANLNPDKATQQVRATLENDDPNGWAICRWYEEVFERELGVDIFQHPFDAEKGYGVFQSRGLRILLLRLEDLTERFAPAISEWLEVPEDSIRLVHSNPHRGARYSDVHRYVTENLRLSREACKRIYSTRVVQHFYTADLIAELTDKWCR